MRIVVKVGTSTLAHATGRMNIRHVEDLVKVLSDLKNAGHEVILVSSGAIGMGVGKLNLPGKPSDMPSKQAAAAVGQCELMYTYDRLFLQYNHTVAQILLTGEDVDHAERRQNFENTLERLLELGALPIINENDTIATAEIKVGDNDTLGAIVACSIHADLLVLLSDIQGLYTADPRKDPGARLIPVVEEITGQPAVTFTGAEAKNVTFSYGGETILDNLSVSIPQGSIVGITGRSGSGKSTLLKLFMRFWETQQGEIALSHTNVNRINTQNLREMESFVTQETHLFHDSIRRNLCIAKLDATQEELEDACRKASVHDWIQSLPQGYDTQIGELGSTLSGGERQRLGLARAFLHGGSFLLLDEPTSNLDSLNEGVILKSLKEEMGARMVVLVSHRTSTMRIADQVYSVEHGRTS